MKSFYSFVFGPKEPAKPKEQSSPVSQLESFSYSRTDFLLQSYKVGEIEKKETFQRLVREIKELETHLKMPIGFIRVTSDPNEVFVSPNILKGKPRTRFSLSPKDFFGLKKSNFEEKPKTRGKMSKGVSSIDKQGEEHKNGGNQREFKDTFVPLPNIKEELERSDKDEENKQEQFEPNPIRPDLFTVTQFVNALYQEYLREIEYFEELKHHLQEMQGKPEEFEETLNQNDKSDKMELNSLFSSHFFQETLWPAMNLLDDAEKPKEKDNLVKGVCAVSKKMSRVLLKVNEDFLKQVLREKMGLEMLLLMDKANLLYGVSRSPGSSRILPKADGLEDMRTLFNNLLFSKEPDNLCLKYNRTQALLLMGFLLWIGKQE